MARGLPLIWSALLAFPYLGGGAYSLTATDQPGLLGWSLVTFGSFIVLIGLYVHVIAAPDPPELYADEAIIDRRNPSQRVAIARIASGGVVLGIAAYLFVGTRMPYMYPTVAFLVGLYQFSKGVYRYWSNCLQTYYVTNRRVISAYRFFSLIQKEIPLDKVRGIQERKSFTETLVGLGNVRIASGAGGQTLEISIQNIGNPTDFANRLRELVSEDRVAQSEPSNSQ